MNNLKKSNTAAKEIAEIIGCKPDLIADMQIVMKPGDVARARVEFLLTEEQWQQIGKASEQ